MRGFFCFATLCLSILLCSNLLHAQSALPFSIEEYQKYMQQLQKTGKIPQSASQPTRQTYETPPIYDSKNLPKTQQLQNLNNLQDLPVQYTPEYLQQMQLLGQYPLVEVMESTYFDDYVIIGIDTVQTIRKAMPRKLEKWGSKFFANITEPVNPSAQMPVEKGYILGSGDELYIAAWGGLNSDYTASIDREGSIYLPEIGAIAIGGLTLEAARMKIRSAFENTYADVDINLTLASVKSIRVYIVGHAKNPGVYDLSGISFPMNAISAAGGPDSVGSYRQISILRGNKKIATFDVYEFIATGHSEGNIQLASGDVVAIGPAGSEISLRGLVRSPGIYEMLDGETITDLLEFAGGILAQGSAENILVDRITNGFRASGTISLSDTVESNKTIFDGDDISIFPVSSFRKNTVFLEGYVPQPGAYGWHENLHIADLFADTNSLFHETYLERVSVLRNVAPQRDSIIAVNLAKAIAQDPTENILLAPGDRIIIKSKNEFVDAEYVNVFGAVRTQGSFALYRDMRVSDLLFEASGLRVNAVLDTAEIIRVKGYNQFEKITINLNDIFAHPKTELDVTLQDRDFLFVRSIPDWKLTRTVTMLGEVKYPGTYALLDENEKLSEVLKRAGGITERAFPQGAVFKRTEVLRRINRNFVNNVIKNTQTLVADSTGAIDTLGMFLYWNPEDLKKMIVDMTDIIDGKDDMIMRHGDTVFIPQRPDGVSIIGAVGSNGTIKFLQDKSINYYVKRAGGFTRNADKGEVRLIKANGKVFKVSGRYNDVDPGDVIVVPQRIIEDNDVLGTIKDIAVLISSLATALYVLLKL